MTRDDFIIEVLDACANFHWEFNGVYKHYELVAVTNNFVRISVISWGFETGYAKCLDFQNDINLIDDLLNTL